MQDDKVNYVGKGWANDYGINLQLNLEDLKKLPVDAYGCIKIYVGKRKEADPKSKATHYAKESKPIEKNPFD